MEKDLYYLSDIEFPVTIIEHQKTDLGPIFEAHSHKNQLQIFYITQGNCEIFCTKKTYSLTDNNYMLILPQELHYGRCLSIPLHFYVIRIDLDLLSTLSPGCCRDKYFLPILQGYIPFHHLINSQTVRDLIWEMIQIGQRKEVGYELILMNLAYRILASLLQDNAVYLTPDLSSEYLMKKRQRFEKLFTYIREHLSDNLTTSSLANQCNMSVAYFCRYFKECTNQTPINYINKLRLEKAVLLLNQGNMNITEVTYSCGFHDSNYFSRIFHKYMHQTPSEFLSCSRKYRI